VPILQTCSEIARDHLRLSLADGVGPILFNRLIARFGSAESVLAAPCPRIEEVQGVGRKTAEAIQAAARSDAWRQEIDLAARLGVRILCRPDPEFPESLRQIPDPPICLYVMGQLKREDALAIAIVGSRQASLYGLEQAQRFTELLSQTGLAIVSGMARGIDQAAHMAALRVAGRTIAVLGCGLSHCYPPESVELRGRIAACGAVLSELPLKTAPDAKNFPARNRIIAGLSLGTLVIEAARRSGALITARLANEYNREVFALPGRVDTPTAQGANDLISQGFAKLVTNVGDILDALGDVGESLARSAGEQLVATQEPEAPPGSSAETPADGADTPGGSTETSAGPAGPPAASAQSAPPAAAGRAATPRLPQAEAAVYKALTKHPMHMERVAAAVDLPISQVSAALTLLQLKGLVRQLPGNQFVRRA
jgi:DNA processing protein